MNKANQILSKLNAAGILLLSQGYIKNYKPKQHSFTFNLILSLLLIFALIVMTYGSYRRQTD